MSQETGTPATGSPLSRSFIDASSAIDDLTRSLVDYSRVSTPEPPSHLPRCQCDTEDSEYTRAWLAVKAKLESRLVLSAEVGQALLQRHEAYVRRVQATEHAGKRAKADGDGDHPSDPEIDPITRREMEDRISQLSKENAVLEKRFSQALVNNELAEVSNKTLSADLEELRVGFNRLSAEHARSVGCEARLRDALQERDDLHQERDIEAQKLRAAEARLTSLGDKCAKLDLQVRALEQQLEEERANHGHTSEEVVHEAKQWLAGLQHSSVSVDFASSIEHHDEIMKLLESLVADKEALRKSNVELQDLLSESRETLQALQEEAGERVQVGQIPSPLRPDRPRDVSKSTSSPPVVYGTAPGPLSPISAIFLSHDSPPSRRSFEPLTPETSQRPLSRGSRQPRHFERSSDIDIDLEAGSTTDESGADDTTPVKSRKGKTYSLQRHRAVQTDPRGWIGTLSPTGYCDQQSLSVSPYEGESESSSLADNPSTLGILLDHVQQLFNRIAQADARTLTTRLKRQNILGADVGHLSHSTVNGIVTEVVNLRAIFRAALEDDKFTTICTRRDLRALLKFLKDIFRELGTLRTTLNDIVLDPSIAPKVREMTLNSKDESSSGEKAPSLISGSGWMAPLSKLFGSTTSGESKIGISRGRSPLWASPRSAPKSGPATSASTTTVNVEFTGTGAGRAVTNVPRPVAKGAAQDAILAPVATRSTSLNLMGIFAGAPRNDAWVVLPPGPSKQQGSKGDQLRRTTLGRAAGRSMDADDTDKPSSLSRNVDAVIDPQASSEERGGIDPARTLRTRGLSDSSIRSTFLHHGEAAPAATQASKSPNAQSRRRVLGALGMTALGVRPAAAAWGANGQSNAASPSSSAKELSHSRAASPRSTKPMPAAATSSWAAASRTLDAAPDLDAYVGSFISNAPMQPLDRREGEL